MVAADKLARWNALVASHRETLSEVIRIAEAHPHRAGTPLTVRARCTILAGLATQARCLLILLNHAAASPSFHRTHGSLGAWGRNGRAPYISGLLRSAQFHAQALAGERKAA